MNKLYKALVYDRQVSLSLLDTTQLVNDAIKIHSLEDEAAVSLGGLLTCGAYMAGCLKSERGAVSLTVKGENCATVSVSGDVNLHIRGYIDGDGKPLKGGNLTVIKNDGFFRPFIGTTELVSDDVSENLTEYFMQSEQIKTFVKFTVKVANGKCLYAGGLVMQLLPGTSFENEKKAEIAVKEIDVDKLLQDGIDSAIDKYFAEEEKKAHIYLTYPEYKCNCSRKKITGVIIPLGKDELLKIAEDEGAVKVHCHYCNTDYSFLKEDILKLF